MISFNDIHPFLISLIIGSIIGIERERSHPQGTQSLGVRTFILIGLLGTLTSYLGNNFFTIGSITFIAALLLLGYWRTSGTNGDRGLTTEVAAIVVFGLGYLAMSNEILALILSIGVFTILFSRTWFHTFSRETLQPAEIQAALILGILLVGVVPFLPNYPVDPWNLIIPKELASVIIALSSVQFISYVATRILGARIGLMFSGFFGGLISSTSIFASLPPRATKRPELFFPILAAILLSTMATLMESLFIVVLISPDLLVPFGLPAGIMSATCLVLAINFKNRVKEFSDENDWQKIPPLDLKSVFKMTFFISSMLLSISLMNRWLGENGSRITAFLGGLFELQGVTYATSSLYANSQLSIHSTLLTLFTALAASFISKFFLLWSFATHRFAIWATICLLIILGTGGLSLWLIN